MTSCNFVLAGTDEEVEDEEQMLEMTATRRMQKLGMSRAQMGTVMVVADAEISAIAGFNVEGDHELPSPSSVMVEVKGDREMVRTGPSSAGTSPCLKCCVRTFAVCV